VVTSVTGRGGTSWGTAIGYHKKLGCKLLHISTHVDPCETIMLSCNIDKTLYTVIGSYWAPEYVPTMEEWRAIMAKGDPPYMILGDLNAHQKELLGSNYNNQRGTFLGELILEFDLILWGEGHTCYRPGMRPSTIDLACISSDQ